MRPDHLPARRPAARPGFTLVELLVVIIIVAVIAGLAIPAVMRAQNAARNAAIKSEIDQLHMAIMNYKNEYGSFPPCIDPVGVGGPVHKHLQRVFPRVATAALPNVALLNALKPDNALVTWLNGFTDNPMDPLALADTSQKKKKLFDFDQSRVVNNTFYPTGKAGSPYVYIPSSQYGLSAPPTGRSRPTPRTSPTSTSRSSTPTRSRSSVPAVTRSSAPTTTFPTSGRAPGSTTSTA
jgi:prepilin-type N-terminal cleavage/methylation domain-containing protein